MPKDCSIKSVLVIGAGPIVISQGCEFDYSGTQACKALKEEGCRVILINPNPATIMTDPQIADVTYIEPFTLSILEKIIEEERPDALLPTMGGQTALNWALKLEEAGILQKYSVRLLGLSIQTIEKAENRQQFKNLLQKCKLDQARSFLIKKDMVFPNKNHIDFCYPRIIRTSFTLGGDGSGIVYNEDELIKLCEGIFKETECDELLVEEALIGWKEFELEVMRDQKGNCIVVCTIENIDPLGVHTGDSITVAPAQTLTDKEYQKMRDWAFLILNEVEITSGGCNVQFGVHPETGRLIVIEINPRVSRSSALASKATGYPIAKVATKIALGYTLNELSNPLGGNIPASFEPTLDYVVVKIPRFNFDKFPGANSFLTTQMKSIGEVMAIGGNFQEALQKALRSLEKGWDGFSFPVALTASLQKEDLLKKLIHPHEERIFYIAHAFHEGWTIEYIYKLTFIDPWFLEQIKELVFIEEKLKKIPFLKLTKEELVTLKGKGFSDKRLATLMKCSPEEVTKHRHSLSIRPVYKCVDSCAGEFPTNIPYLYSTYETECEANPSTREKIIILGSGPNRIGQGIEFDYCCVQASLAAQELGYEVIMINCNPATVSTDYDCSHKLYFEPLALEEILEIIHKEKPYGVLTQFGGQTPILLTEELHKAKVRLLGTQFLAVQQTEDRQFFKTIIEDLTLNQPLNDVFTNAQVAFKKAEIIGYPLILRPSYVIGGVGLAIVSNQLELQNYLTNSYVKDTKVLIEKYIKDAIEVDVDAICDGESILICGIMEQLEIAGVHSGDSSCIFPTYSLNEAVLNQIRTETKIIALHLGIKGFINIQFIIKDDILYVLEVNPRASRTIPFLTKATGIPFVKIAIDVILGNFIINQNLLDETEPKLYFVKKPVFSFTKIPGSSDALGPEMKSTGEVMIIGESFEEIQIKVSISEESKLSLCSNNIKLYPLQTGCHYPYMSG